MIVTDPHTLNDIGTFSSSKGFLVDESNGRKAIVALTAQAAVLAGPAAPAMPPAALLPVPAPLPVSTLDLLPGALRRAKTVFLMPGTTPLDATLFGLALSRWGAYSLVETTDHADLLMRLLRTNDSYCGIQPVRPDGTLSNRCPDGGLDYRVELTVLDGKTLAPLWDAFLPANSPNAIVDLDSLMKEMASLGGLPY